jgi:hypothetical protein
VHGASPPVPDPGFARQRQVVDAFFAAARSGNFDALVAVLDPNVVLRSDGGEKRRPFRSFAVERAKWRGRRCDLRSRALFCILSSSMAPQAQSP